MADQRVLRISDVPSGDRRRVEVTWQDGPARQVAVATFSYRADDGDAERIRWYLEDYAEYPADPGPRLARDAEGILASIGTSLFGQVFRGLDAAGIWDRARAGLSRVRIEVDADPADVPGLPWELLRDPGTDTALALGAGEFVRTHLQAAGGMGLPQAGGDRLRVLLVICRPGGRDDVPFRSVASRLVRGGAAGMEGLDLDVLRPATYPRLAAVLRQAADAGRPYHVVHFDGHGTYLDLLQLSGTDAGGAGEPGADRGTTGGLGVSPLHYGMPVAGPVRPGQHGYLIFENPGHPSNQQFADGPALGRLLAETGVPVLVLNACRSAYAEAAGRPGDAADEPDGAQPGGDGTADGVSLADVHARIRAYGSLAAEVADAGVPGVVAMRYNVYVVTAAQYVADLYGHLLGGQTLGHAATEARRALAASPARQITVTPVDLQDWAVPVVYEAAPLTLLRPGTRDAPLIRLTMPDGDTAGQSGTAEVPGPPDAGFFGRDETLLALDRAFDAQQVVLLHAFAGAGKSSTAAEFARWYSSTGGLDHPDGGRGLVLWSSFEHHLPLSRLLDTAGDRFAGLLEANDIHWQAITDRGQRLDLLLQILAQVPVLWVWDNIEPVTGFPAGTASAWTEAEQDELAGFLRTLTARTRCKVLLTSRRDEQRWLGDQPARLHLPPMPMRERLQLAAAIAARRGAADPGINWRPLLRYTGGNPLTITVLVSQAVRDNLVTTAQTEAFVARLRAGEQELEPGEDAALGRTRSLHASLSYGFGHAFTEAERAQLAVLHVFRDTVDADALRLMGDPDLGDDIVPQLAGLTRDTTIALLDKAADTGLLSPMGNGYYSIHPALPWYFTAQFTAAYGQPGDPAAVAAAHAYVRILGDLGSYYHKSINEGRSFLISYLAVEEANLQHALTLAREGRQWPQVIGCLQGLRSLYEHTGRDGEWARLVTEITPDFTDPATDGPLPGMEAEWNIICGYRVRIARLARDWPTATRLQQATIARNRELAATALARPDSELTADQRSWLRSLIVDIQDLAIVLIEQEDPACLPQYKEAIALAQRLHDRLAECNLANDLGYAYLDIPAIRDLDEAERWFQHSLSLEAEDSRVGRGKSFISLGRVAHERFEDARSARQPGAVLFEHWTAARNNFMQALDLLPADDAEDLDAVHNQLGNLYSAAGDSRQALDHYQQSLQYAERRGDVFGAGQTRHNIALLLFQEDRPGDALHYARAARDNFAAVGPGASQHMARADRLIAHLEEETR